MASKYAIALLAIAFLVEVADAAGRRGAGEEWRVYINSSCIVTDEPFLLPEMDQGTAARVIPLFGVFAARLAGTLINAVFEGAVGSIAGGAARKETKYATAIDFNLYLADLHESPAVYVTPRLGCFTVVAGDFEERSVDCTGEYIPRVVSPEALQQAEENWQTTRTDNSVENVLRRANVCLTGQAKSVYEARILFSDDKTAYRMSNAGYWINSLSTTRSTKAKRDLLYTLEIVQPADAGSGRVLSTAWVNVGQVAAGDIAFGDEVASRSDWLRVPPISSAAKRAYQLDTAVHQDVIESIETLERTVIRDERLLDGIRARAVNAGAEVRKALDREIAKIQVRLVTAEAMLDARRSEYGDLPQSKMFYMPVTMRFGITETRSAKKTMRTLASILEMNKDTLTQSASNMIGLDKSLDLDAFEGDLDTLRQEYIDALVVVEKELSNSDGVSEELSNSDGVSEESQRKLDLAKQSYNAARIADGIAPIE